MGGGRVRRKEFAGQIPRRDATLEESRENGDGNRCAEVS